MYGEINLKYMEETLMKNNKICELLGIKYPIFQGAMAWVSGGELAGAVSRDGGSWNNCWGRNGTRTFKTTY